eukprot:scaffold563_cov410-Prasinococcus_capsulatus_cf.AAC.8
MAGHVAGDACSESMVSETSGAWLSIRWLNAVTLGDGSRNKEHSFLGHGHARNRGVSRSCGDILMFLDADDLFMDPHMLHLWLPLALNEKVCRVLAGSLGAGPSAYCSDNPLLVNVCAVGVEQESPPAGDRWHASLLDTQVREGPTSQHCGSKTGISACRRLAPRGS